MLSNSLRVEVRVTVLKRTLLLEGAAFFEVVVETEDFKANWRIVPLDGRLKLILISILADRLVLRV